MPTFPSLSFLAPLAGRLGQAPTPGGSRLWVSHAEAFGLSPPPCSAMAQLLGHALDPRVGCGLTIASHQGL